jgi:hypothetical protein
LAEGHSLAQLLQTAIDFELGEIFSFLPRGFSPATSTDWTASLAMSHARSLSLTSRILAAAADDRETAVCIFEDAASHPGDEWLRAARSPTRRFGDEVYHIARAVSAEQIAEAMNQAETPLSLIGALVDPFPEWEYPADDRITAHDLRRFVTATVAVLVDAFDGEGYVVWAQHR